MTSARLGALTWSEAADRARSSLLVVPLGATEQHGPHLPLATDTIVAEALAVELAERRFDVLVGPVVPYGSSGEHRDFPGTLSIGAEALAHLLVELVRSADAFGGVVFVSGHGGNATTLVSVEQKMRGEGRRVLCWWPRAAVLDGADVGERRADAHAGRVETSMLADLAPGSIRIDRAAAGETRPVGDLAKTLVREGVAAVSTNGVLGDPTGASAAEGRMFLAALSDDLESSVESFFGASRP